MAGEKGVENYQHSDLESKTSESATEIAEQNIVSEMVRVPPNESDYASPSEKVISDVIETFRIGPLELEYQNCKVKNTERHSKNGLPMDHPPQFKSFGENREVTDEPCPSTRPYISSAGYHTYTADGVLHFYPWDSENFDYRPRRRAPNSSKSNGFSSNDLNGPSASYNVSSNSRMKSHQVPSSSGKSSYHSQPLRQLHKECYPAMRSSSPRNHHQHGNASVKPRNDFGFTSLQSYKGNEDSDVSKELICGPRALGCDDSVKTNETEEDLPYFSRRKNFNLPDFQTEYVNAKFYIIKSFGEDNVHKSVKYGVWSSTPYGNEKLEVAYHEAKAKGIETGKKCPIFFFFSVARSGKFVGLAEMIGRVDFNRDLDFWQLKWSGFFPVKWHILKDIPHSKLRHIILKENDNRPVTCTRDTQEINLCQGIEMLKIFKNYSAKTSLLDDFFFYENREKLRVAERKRKSERQQLEECESDSYRDEDAAGYGRSYRDSARVDMTSVICRTRNLSLNPHAP
ncbi:unnamed protein product [Rhodiola kirilowii]